MKKFKTIISYEVVVEAEDDSDAVEKILEHLDGVLLSDVFGFDVDEIEDDDNDTN